MASSDGRSSRAWKTLAAQLKVELPPICHLCGGTIDLSLPHLDRMAWTLDHVLSLHDYPHLAMDPVNLRPAHRSCNSRKGKGQPPSQHINASRTWC